MPESALVTGRSRIRPRAARGTTAGPRPAEPCRHFTLLDAMILTAATAAGLSLSRLLVPDLKPLDLVNNLRLLAQFSTPVLGAWGLAWLALRFRGPRPRIRRLMRRPGTVACIAATAILAIRWGHEPFVMLLTGRWDGSLTSEQILPTYFFVGPGVLAAWLTLLLGGRSRPERGWIDATGKAIGVAWIALFLLLLGHSVQREWQISHPRSPRPRRAPTKRVATPDESLRSSNGLALAFSKILGTES